MIYHTTVKPSDIKDGIIACACDCTSETIGDTERAIHQKWPTVEDAQRRIVAAYGRLLLGSVQTVTVDKGTAEDGGEVALVIVANMFVLKRKDGVITYDVSAMESTTEQLMGIAAATNLPVYIQRMDGHALSVITALQERSEFSNINVFVYGE